MNAFRDKLTAIGAMLLGAACTSSAHGQVVTQIDDVVMYAIDGDTMQLLRYNFGTDEFTSVGTVIDQHGHVLNDFESLAFIPTGPDKGYYSTRNSNLHKKILIKLNPLTAAATVSTGPQIAYIRGMVAFQQTPGNWKIYAASSSTPPSLVVINPVTGSAESWVPIADSSGDEVVMEGLALNSDGDMYGISHNGSTISELWTIDPATGVASSIGQDNWARIESLEFAFGDNTPDIGGLPAAVATWDFSKGVLIGFSDNSDTLLVINPATGEGVALENSFTTLDAEGLTFTTADRDAYLAIRNGFD
ncbi:MAG: hypothetical protein O6768_08235 [Planctomycetota bacterium]|nr:hypothetical protein [Planctomycetota bacterium]